MTAARQTKTETQPVADKELLKAVPTAAPKATRKAPAKAPAKAAAPEKPAEQAKSPSTKIKWTIDGERDEKGRVNQHGTSPINGLTYVVNGEGTSWSAVVTGGKGGPEVLVEGVSHTTAYLKCTAHAKAAATA